MQKAPGAYQPEKVNMNHTPAYSFGTKNYHKKIIDSPAPCAYHSERVNLDHSPAYSFGSRNNYDKPTDTPGISNISRIIC